MLFDFCYVLACIRFTEQFEKVRVHTRTISNYEIDFYLNGNRIIIIDGVEYEVNANTCIFRKPGQVVTGIGDALESYCLTVNFFSDESKTYIDRKAYMPIAKCLENPVLDSIPSVFSVTNISAVCDLYERLTCMCICEPDNYEGKKNIVEKLLLLLASESIKIQELQTSQKNKLERVKNYLQNNFGCELYIDDIAKSFGYTRDYLIRLFKKEYSCTPKEFLIRVRMENARHMLLTSNLSISEIAGISGYTSFSLFSATFKSRFGMSPNEYRNRLP